ncbi:MAG: leucine-rich repeat domain-containing protein, partial [Ruminococcus sp.]|nr:leucine-rich repeat domain-containing protein [Ruminococcus sp.]
KTRAVSFVTALLLVFTLLPLLPDGMMTAEAAERRFSFLDQKTGLEWVFTLENGGSGDAHIISVRDTLGRDDDSDASNDITRITVPETVTDNVYGYTHNVTHIACELDGNDFTPTFAKFKKLKRVDLPKTLKTLGQRTFYEHETLEDIYIETGVTLIGAQAFFGCKKLKAVNIPASVTTISNHAFYRCTSLSRIYIPKTVTDIGSNSFEEIADDATIYGYTGTKAEEYANHWNINFEALDAIVDKVPYSIPAFSGSITFTLRNGNTVTRTDGISSTIMGNVDRSKDATIAADKTPDGMTFEGYEIKYDISFTDNTAGSTKPAYSETFTQTPEENTFSFHLPDEAYEKMFGYIVLWNSNKSRYRFSGTVTITPIFKKIPHTLKIVNGTATLDPSKGSGAQISATEGDVVYLYGKKPDDGNYYFTGWTVDDEDIELKNPDSSWTTFTMPARDVTLTCNFTKGQKYGLYVDSVQVTTENAKDVLGNGAFTFNEKTKTLYINDDYTTENSTLISCNYSFNDTLTITPKKDVTLSAKTHVIRMGGINGIITGEHKLKMNNTSYGIYLEDSDFRIINADVEINASYQGIGGYSSSSNYLTVSNSAVHVKSEKGEEVTTTAGMYVNGAVCNMNKGLTLTNETITAPENWEEVKKSARSFIKDISNGKPAKEVVFAPVAHTHTLQKHAAKAGSCLENGNTVYWECSDCGQYFKDKDGKIPVAKDSWVIERTGHKLTWIPAKNANCTEDGHKGAYDCSVCGKHFNSSDKFTINETQEWLRPKLGHSMSKSYHTAAKQPTFYDKGNIEYWKCTRCSKYFS